ncbi:UDP-N-acetylglucosamine 2-epimerase (non-hydrolyzing) [candidate division KSB1 bacterium]|nr:UDP-N-acetylglucosamine 2-epimerase (non-hydrolyzing) [candidate division KSB1 bacterium]
MRKKNIVMTIFGTRPEAIKMAPVIQELWQQNIFETVVCTTSQHRQMLDQMLSLFDIVPDIDLRLMQANQTLSSLTAAVMLAVTETLERVRPSVVLVQGDTTTAAVAALASFYQQIPVGHVEAGLRTFDIYSPFPEEVNRKLISTIAAFNFAPTERAVENLLQEGVPRAKILKTGNTIVDALRAIDEKYGARSLPLDIPNDKKLILVTAHRRENFGAPLANICAALQEIVVTFPEIEIVYPVHLNPRVKNDVEKYLAGIERIHLIAPLDYHQLVAMIKRAHIILTDSGGIQEEAPSFGKPVLVLRSATERPEGIEAGVAKLVGSEKQSIIDHVTRLLRDQAAYQKMAMSTNPYGDGRAAQRIVQFLSDSLTDSMTRAHVI